MPTFEAWLMETYGSDLSKITEIKHVPSGVTGTWVGRRGFQMFSRLLYVMVEAVNANIRISDACADTCTLFCADFSGLSALVNLTTLNLSGTKIREF